MRVFFEEKKFPVDCSVLALHGGAGPVDPQGEYRLKAIEELGRAADRVAREKFAFSFAAAEAFAPTEAERIALHGAALLEAHPMFNAGYGAALQEDGVARVSAAFMESDRGDFSAVMNATGVLHPSQLAFVQQFNRFTMVDTNGSQILKQVYGVPEHGLVTEKRRQGWIKRRGKAAVGFAVDRKGVARDGHGTIGSVVCTADRKLAATTSTGGVGNELLGRVGDTPTVAGNYCSDKVAVSATGTGEHICNLAVCARIAILMDSGASLSEAVRTVIELAEKRSYNIGVIAVGPEDDGITAVAAVAHGEISFAFKQL